MDIKKPNFKSRNNPKDFYHQTVLRRKRVDPKFYCSTLEVLKDKEIVILVQILFAKSTRHLKIQEQTVIIIVLWIPSSQIAQNIFITTRQKPNS